MWKVKFLKAIFLCCLKDDWGLGNQINYGTLGSKTSSEIIMIQSYSANVLFCKLFSGWSNLHSPSPGEAEWSVLGTGGSQWTFQVSTGKTRCALTSQPNDVFQRQYQRNPIMRNHKADCDSGQMRGIAVNSVSYGKKKVLRSVSIQKALWKRWDLGLKLSGSTASGEVRQRWLTRGISRGCCYIMGAGRAMLGTQETYWGIS